MSVRSVGELDLRAARAARRAFYPSPTAWEDEVLYFLLLDRFSDGSEDGYLDVDGRLVSGRTPRLTEQDFGNAITDAAAAARWRDAGAGWTGGTLGGLRSKLGYLRRLGV